MFLRRFYRKFSSFENREEFEKVWKRYKKKSYFETDWLDLLKEAGGI